MMISATITNQRLFAGLIIIILGIASCKESPRVASGTSHIRFTDEKLIDYNRGVIKTEDQEIEDFLKRYGWDMKQTSTGLRYIIYSNGDGKQASNGMRAHFLFSIKLLDGTLTYSSDSSGKKSMILGHGEVVSGLEEGMLLLREGDHAKFIIPSYLGHGVLGDQQKIPPGATLVYDVNLLELESINQ